MSKRRSGTKQPPKGDLLFSVPRSEFTVQTFTAGGPGGQHQNTSNTAVRIIHKESGAAGESREHRSQTQNKKAAMERLVASKKFQVYLNRRTWKQPIDPVIETEKAMKLSNILIEGKDEDGNWELID
jgi:protein subunit release factor A